MTPACIARLRLTRTEGVGPITFHRLLERFGAPEPALAALPALARSGGRTQPLRIPSERDARRELDQLAAFGARLLWWDDPGYPELLAQTEAAPPVITVQGDASALTARSVAIVGARNASANGKHFAETLARDLAASGLVVVSGMARGVDAAAHAGALRAGRTVAAIAGGIDVVYPPQNASLQQQAAGKGAVVAIAPFGTAPQAKHFPRRNRIIAGLALGTVVVEAALQSGSLITARLAGEFGRELFAVPGSPLDPRCRGSNDLLRRGAHLVEDASDVLEALATPSFVPRQVQLAEPAFPAPEPPADLTSPRRSVLEHLGYDPVQIDTLVRMSGVPSSLVMAVLLELELAGQVEILPGQLVARVL